MSATELFAQVVVERVFNSLSGGFLIAALAWLVLRVVGRQNSGTRFAVWFSALLAIAGLPFVPSLLHNSLIHNGAITHGMPAEITLPHSWAVTIFGVWIIFATLAASRVLVGLWNVRRLSKSGVALAPSELHPALRETLGQCEAKRPVTLCSSSMVSVPTAIGFFKPVILIPEWALRDLPVEELKIILLHEFAHLGRWDDWTNMAQKIVRIVFFFHPAVWWIEKRLSLEREMACDDAVLAETRNPRAYAECLVSLAEKSFAQRGLAMAQAAVSHARETSIRLAQILDIHRPHATRVFTPALGLMTVFAGACLIVLPNAPRMVAFENVVNLNKVATAKGALARQVQPPVVPVSAPVSNDAAAERGMGKVVATPAVYRPSKSSRRKINGMNLSQSAGPKRYTPSVIPVPVAAKQSTPAPEFLVVMQTAELDDHGSVVLRTSVWTVRFVTPNRNVVQPGVLAQSI